MRTSRIATHGSGEGPIFGRERELSHLYKLPDRVHELGDRSPLPAQLPLTGRLEQAFASRAAALPSHTRTLLLLAAADDEGVLSEILTPAAVMDGGEPRVESVVPAVDARLTEIDGTRLVFRHPLVRSAVSSGRA